MEQQQKESPVEIVQKLIAIHTTRKEAGERMIKNNASAGIQDRLKLAAEQSDRFIKALLNELSEFGDAVQSEVNREDEFHAIWKDSMTNIDSMDNSVLSDTFTKLENSLVNIYSQIINTNDDLPLTLKDLLNTQIEELKQ